MLTKESKIRILENFHGIDYVLFGKPVGKVGVCCPFFIEEFLSIKGALLSIMVEMHKLVNHKPKVIKEKVKVDRLVEMAKVSASTARKNCKRLVVSENGKEDVKNTIREALSKTKKKKINLDEMVKTEIKRKAYGLAIDNLLIGRIVNESKNFNKLNSWNGKILEDAYKILRDNLVESAMTIMENV